MHLGIFAKTFARPTLEETLDAVTGYGLTHVQFNMSCVGLPTLPERIEEGLCRSIARAHRDRGLTIAAISGTFNLCDPDEARLAGNLERLEVLAAACRWLDTRIITLCTGTRDPDDMWKWSPENVRRGAWETLAQSVKHAVRIADRHEVTLAFEPEIHNIVCSAMRARRLLDEVGSPWLKVVIDPANLFRPGEVRPFSELLDEAFDWIGGDIVLAHAKPPYLGDLPDQAGWLEDFFGKNYEVLGFAGNQATVGTQGLALAVSSVVPRVDSERCSFFKPYTNALGAIGYNGACIIHGVEEHEVGLVVDRIRRRPGIAESTDSGN
jgi:sugar phosphate isomerase/epimerase